MHPPNCHYHPDLCYQMYHAEVPEPSIWILMALGLLAMALVYRRKKV